ILPKVAEAGSTSQTEPDSSVASAMSALPSGEKATLATHFSWCRNSLSSLPVSGSHSRIRPSLPPAASNRPSGGKRKARAPPGGPPAATTGSADGGTAQSRTRPSDTAAATCLPSGDALTSDADVELAPPDAVAGSSRPVAVSHAYRVRLTSNRWTVAPSAEN